MSLNTEQRAMVARAVTGHRCFIRNDGLIEIAGGDFEFAGEIWAPDEYVRQWKAILIKACKLIREIPETNHRDMFRRRAVLERFNKAVAEDSPAALEQLAFELLENK